MAGRAVPNLLGLWLDPAAGLLRWAPVLALAFFGAWRLARSRRERVAAAIPARREAERVAELLVATVGAQWLIAAFTSEARTGRGSPACRCSAACPRWPRGGVGPAARARRRHGAVLITLALSAWVLGGGVERPGRGLARRGALSQPSSGRV